MIKEYLHETTIQLKATASNREEAISLAAAPLITNGCISTAYIDKMLQALKTFGPYMVLIPGIALAHADPGPEVLKECMSMLTLQEPVVFGHESNDPVHTIFVFGSDTKDKHMEVLMELSKLLMKDDFIELLKQCRDVKELQSYFAREELRG